MSNTLDHCLKLAIASIPMTASQAKAVRAMDVVEAIPAAGDQVINRFRDRRETIEALREADPDFRDLHDDYNKVIDMLSETKSQSERSHRDLTRLREVLAAEIEAYLETSASSESGHRPDGS